MCPARMERVESGIRTVIAFNEALNRHDISGMLQLLSDDSVFENTDGMVYRGKAAISQFWQYFIQQSPQAHFKIEEVFGYGVRCIMRWRYDWVDASGNPKHVRGVDLYRVQNSLIVEKLSYVKG